MSEASDRMPRVSVGIPVYNGERFLEAALASIRAQTVDDLEIVVSDNASTDRTVEIVRDVASDDPRVRLLRSAENLGAAANYNRVFRESRGHYFRWAPSDDLMHPTLLERCCAVLDSNPDCVLAYPKTLLIDAAGEVLGEDGLALDLRQPEVAGRARAFIWQINLCHPVLGVHRRAVLARSPQIQGFIGSDAVLIYWMALAGRIFQVPECLYSRRVHRDASQEVATTRKALRAWFDPNASSALDWLTPRQRLLVEYARETIQFDMPLPTRGQTIAAIVVAWLMRQARVRAGYWRARLLHGQSASSEGSRFGNRL